MGIRTLTVTELTNYLKRVLINDPILNNLSLKGEISNFKFHNSGHAYFSLKDINSKVKCIMFSREFSGLEFIPKDGMKVIAKGYISIYDRNGEYQLYVKELQKEGLGDLYIKYEMLKKKLQEKGYFNLEYKKKIPYLPKRIAVITSPTGAAIRDVISVIKRRNSYTDIVVFPVLVQGDRAAYQISDAIRKINNFEDIELIILTRGGGSIEELWAFNEEIVAESIFNSNKPIISAVGHETDFTIADFVSDLRAPTPSAAGELAVPDLGDVKNNLNLLYNNLKGNIVAQVSNYRQLLDNFNTNRLKKNIYYKINEEKMSLDYLNNNIYSIILNKLASCKKEIETLGNNLENLNPLSTLSRGYGIIFDSNKRTITDVDGVETGDVINVMLKNGRLKCSVRDIKKGDKLFEGE